ncbi:MAG: SGNH/GDSL hydrolase family protein [Eubacterium sp.]|nr:SGNH/GDSL hydrolase family protein [Eubacterium sp.]
MKTIKENKMRIVAGAVAFMMAIGVLSGANYLSADKKIQANTNATQVTTQAPTTKVPETTKKQTKPKKVKKIKLRKPKIRVKRYKTTSVKVTWKKVKKAKKYIVYSATIGRSFTQVKTTKKRKFVDKKLKRGKTYKYRVVAVTQQQGKTIKSKASKTKKVKIPKKKVSKANVVVCGECFVEGMGLYAKRYLPAKTKLVHKIGISTYGILNTNYIRYGGRTITAVERIARYKPKVVYFLCGMNEAKGNTSATMGNYKKIVKLLKIVKPDIKVVLMALPPVGRSHSSGFASNPKINRVNRAYKKYASKTKNVYYYAGYRSLITDGAGYLKGSANGGDGGHWSASATIKVVKALKKNSRQFVK